MQNLNKLLVWFSDPPKRQKNYDTIFDTLGSYGRYCNFYIIETSKSCEEMKELLSKSKCVSNTTFIFITEIHNWAAINFPFSTILKN